MILTPFSYVIETAVLGYDEWGGSIAAKAGGSSESIELHQFRYVQMRPGCKPAFWPPRQFRRVRCLGDTGAVSGAAVSPYGSLPNAGVQSVALDHLHAGSDDAAIFAGIA